jgi:DNA (cytosine-5)-methyltransferase 1
VIRIALFLSLENGPIISDTASKFSGDTVDLGETSAKKAPLLDLYSGCGGLSTGLCLGAALAGVKLETVIFYIIVWL